MLHLKSLSIDRFKSFKHAEVLFSPGFTCVVGPNGSGKSNICDALLFGLGENSMGRMRVGHLDELIDFSLKKKHGEQSKAHVKLEFAGDGEYTIVRTVKSDGKTEFRVNGKHVARHEVIDILSANRIRADETSTITQGEINRIISLSPKERRELIDIASGITEFESKKADSLRELEKVSQRISETQGMLNEKVGFLRELEKEKESAERYVQFTSKLRSLRYSVLVAKKQGLELALDGYTKEMAITDSKKEEAEVKRSEIAKRMADFEMERQSITHELTTSSTAASEVSAKLEAINRELATLEAEINSHNSSLIEIGTFTEGAEKEMARINATLEAGKATAKELFVKISQLEKEAGVAPATPDPATASEKEMEALNKSIQRLERQISGCQDSMLEIATEASIIKSSRDELSSGISEYTDLVKEKEDGIAGLSKRIDDARKRMKALSEEAKRAESEHERMEKELEAVDEALITLKEQRSEAAARGGNIAEKIKAEFPESKGFYGRASQLCTYGLESSLAVEAAAGSRLEYFVVETIETAEKIISFLKKNELGRATFIPIKDVNVDTRESEVKGAKAVIDAVKFDKKFERVFRYILNNTYIVGGVEEARRLGVGRHRYVTIDGELIEQSGVVSGGHSKRRLSLASIENQIREMEERKRSLHADKADAEESAFAARKGQAAAEMEVESLNREMSSLQSEVARARKAKEQAESKAREVATKLDGIEKRSKALAAERASAEKELESSQDSLRKLYNDAIEATKEMARHGLGKAAREKAEKARKELEELRIKLAETKKESELLESRKADLEKQLEERKRSGRSISESISTKSERVGRLREERKEVEFKIKNSGASHGKAYARLNRVADELQKLSEDNGRINAQLNEIDRQLGDAKVKRSQTETRLSDISAELAAYGDGIELIKGDYEIMEREAGVVQARLNELGNVNMRAPELYEEKKKSVDEALQKSNTLELEKQAVIRMIEEIESKKLQVFMSTFNDVNKNFSKLYNYIFPGRAYIELDNPNDPFSGGIEIKITDANVSKALRSMSGGQKSLILLMMLFSIHLCKPSSLYVFDEVDSALDKENSKKLSQLIKEMSKEAQFVVVSHNDSLIVNADTAVGVVMTNGESKVVGLEVSSITKSAK